MAAEFVPQILTLKQWVNRDFFFLLTPPLFSKNWFGIIPQVFSAYFGIWCKELMPVEPKEALNAHWECPQVAQKVFFSTHYVETRSSHLALGFYAK